MKNLILIFILLVTNFTSFSQYNYQIVITGGNGKTILNDIFDEYETFNRYVNDTISFDSHSLIDATYISNKCESLDYSLEYFNKDKTLLTNNYQQKATCNLLLELYDSYGDGWNGNGSVTITIGGISTSYYLGSGSYGNISLPYSDGQTITITYNPGSWNSENSYKISNAYGTIFSDGPSPTSGLVFTSTEACSPPQQDCEGATMVCSNTSFSGNSNGHGTQELKGSNRGCLSGNEHQSSWYYINVGSSGTLEMTISPTASDDYDWAIWGPFDAVTAAANCSPITTPIRCSYAEGDIDTGMGSGLGCTSRGWITGACYGTGTVTGTGDSEGAGGDGWVAPLNVTEGQIYIMVIDNFSKSNKPFNLTWGGSAELACIDVNLPVELLSFDAKRDGTSVRLDWSTASETNNDYFNIERSFDGYNWDEIYKVSGSGTTSSKSVYSTYDRTFNLTGIIYYRLSQTDFDGKREVFAPKSIYMGDRKIVKIINIIGQEVNMDYKGIKIIVYDNGDRVKTY